MSVNFFALSSPRPTAKHRRLPASGILARFSFGIALLTAGCAQTEGDFQRPTSHTKRMQVRTTAYTHTEAGGVNNAVGSRLRFGGDVSSASADWSWLPVGTRFRVEENGRTYVVEDYGSGLIGKKTVDLYMPTMSMMRAWGVRNVTIEILEWGSRPMSKMLLERRKGAATVQKMLSAMDATH